MEYRNPQYLITAAALAERLADPGLRVVDAAVFLAPAENGYRAESGLSRFNEAHIPGAVFMDLIDKFSDTTTGLGFTLPPPETVADALGGLGVGPHHEVVVYSSGHLMWATRAWWLIRYCGHEQVAVLDGGLAAWQAAGYPVTRDVASHAGVDYAAAPRPALFADIDEVADATKDAGVCTVNVLSPEVYAGTGGAGYGRAGHIPGSLNLHHEELLRDGAFRSADELHAILGAKGLLDERRVITYCGGGIAATIDAFACMLLGKENVAVYDGSMSEWSRDESRPLVVGTDP